MIQGTPATEISISLDNPRIQKHFSNLTSRLGVLNKKHTYGSPIQSISDYARKLGRELSENPSRSMYLDKYIRRNELKEESLEKASYAQEALEASSFKLFENLFEYLNNLIQLRYEMTPTKGRKPVGTSRQLLDEKRPDFDNAITELGDTMKTFLSSLSNQSRDFTEDYIRENHELVHRFMNSNMPKSRIKFRSLLGLNLNADGTKRIKVKKQAPATQARNTNIAYASHYEGNLYRIKLPKNAGTVYAEKISKVYKDGSARFRPTDPAILDFIKRASAGKTDYTVAIIEPKIS